MEFLGFTTQKGDIKDDKHNKENTKKVIKEKGEKMLDSTALKYSVCVFTAIALAIRLHNIGSLNRIAWDEVHFGKFAGLYINRTAFFDLHPPLAKLMIAGVGYVTGYNGTENLRIPGKEFDDYSQFIGMRIGCTILGLMCVPFSLMIVYEKTKSLSAAIMAATFMTFDGGLIVLTKHILLDPICIFFIFGATLGDAKFRNLKESFSVKWWSWLFFTGTMLGGVISSKHIGVFIVAYVGISTIQQLWSLLGNKNITIQSFAKHFSARFVALLMLPVLIYLSSWYLHFHISYKTNNSPNEEGDERFSPQFRTSIEGNVYSNLDIQKYLTYNMDIKMESTDYGCGILHSHTLNYPNGTGSRQQMVTGYYHDDPNNYWFFKPWGAAAQNTEDNIVRNGDLIVLEHRATGRNLHSHKVKATESKEHFQVSGYGWMGKGDANDVWRVEIQGGKKGSGVEILNSQVRLRHYFLGCELACSGYQLPIWGYGQKEIICAKWPLGAAKKTTMGQSDFIMFPLIQAVENSTIPDTAKINSDQEVLNSSLIAQSFWTKFILYHKQIAKYNKILGKDFDGELSKMRNDPYEWPLNNYAQTYSAEFNETRRSIHLLGHPVLWGVNLVVICLLPVIVPLALINTRQSITAAGNDAVEKIDDHVTGAGWMLLGWALHYLPFFLIPRVLYVHHYYPASIFMCMFTAILIDRLIRNLPSKLKSFIILATIFTMVTIFLLFSPLIYGVKGTRFQWENSTYHYLRWNSKWDI